MPKENVFGWHGSWTMNESIRGKDGSPGAEEQLNYLQVPELKGRSSPAGPLELF